MAYKDPDYHKKWRAKNRARINELERIRRATPGPARDRYLASKRARSKRPEVKAKNASDTRKRRSANRESFRAYMRAWKSANRERVRASDKAWRERNPEKVKESRRKYYAATRAEFLARCRNYYARNKSWISERNRAYMRENGSRLYREMRADPVRRERVAVASRDRIRNGIRQLADWYVRGLLAGYRKVRTRRFDVLLEVKRVSAAIRRAARDDSLPEQVRVDMLIGELKRAANGDHKR